MATAHRDFVDPSSVESRDDLRPTDNQLSDRFTPLFGALWLYTDILPVIQNLLDRLQESWHHHSAFLLQEMLDLQILYRNCQTYENLGHSLVPEGALLKSEDVLAIARTVSLSVTANHLETFEDLIIRETRFKLLASAIHLARLLGNMSAEKAEYYWIKKDLITHLESSLRDRSTTKRAEEVLHTFGNYDLYVRYALEWLEELPPDNGVNDLLFGAVARIFLAADHRCRVDLAELLSHFRATDESFHRTRRCVQPFRALRRLSSEAISLKQFASTIRDHEASRMIVAKSHELVDWLILKIELLFRNEFARIQRLRRLHVAATKFRITPGADRVQPDAEEADAAIDLLHVANDIADTFGERTKFDTMKNLCRDVIEQSASERSFQLLRMKAMEVLLSVKQARSGLADICSDESNLIPRPLQAVKGQSAAARVSLELEISKQGFVARRRLNATSIQFSIGLLEEHERHMLSHINTIAQSHEKQGNDQSFAADLENRATDAEKQSQSPSDEEHPAQIDLDAVVFHPPTHYSSSLDGDNTSDTDSLYSRESPEVVAESASSEDFPIVDVEHQSIPQKVMEHIIDPPDLNLHLRPKFQGLSAILTTEALQYHHLLPPKNNVIQELPADEPSCELESPSPWNPTPGRLGSIPTFPYPEHSGLQSPSSLVSPQTPITPDIFLEPVSQAMSATSNLSFSSLQQGPLLELQNPKVAIDPAKKIKFLQSAKKAESVALSPNGEYVAFVFSDRVQVSHITMSSERVSESKVMLTSGRRSGKISTAALSDTHLVAVSDKEIQVCCYVPLRSSPTSPSVRRIEQNAHVTCVAISHSSDSIALGQRIESANPGGSSRGNYAAIQLYSTKLTLRECLHCHSAGDHEFPRHIAFYPDDQTILYANNRTFGRWTRTCSSWKETSMGAFDAKGSGAKGITSLTPLSFSLPTPIPGENNSNIPYHGPHERQRGWGQQQQLYLITSILSNIADQHSSYIASLPFPTSTFSSNSSCSSSSSSKWRSSIPWCDHLVRSTISPDGRLAAFLTLSGHVKIASLVASDDSSRLKMRSIPCEKFQAKKEIEAHYAAKVGIRNDGDGYVVVVVDRYGNVGNIRVSEGGGTR